MAQQPRQRHEQPHPQQLLLQQGQGYRYRHPLDQGYTSSQWATPGGITAQGPGRPTPGPSSTGADPRPWQQHGPLGGSSQTPRSLEAAFVRQSRAVMLLVDKWTARILEANDGALPALGLRREELCRMVVSDLGEGPSTAEWNQAVAALTSRPNVVLRLLIREPEEGQSRGHMRGQLVDLRLQQPQSAEGRGVVCSLAPAPLPVGPPSPASPPSASLEDWPLGDPLGHLPSAPPAPRAAPREAQGSSWEPASKGASSRPKTGRPANQTPGLHLQQHNQHQQFEQQQEQGGDMDTGKGVLKKLGSFLKGLGSERAALGSGAAGGPSPRKPRPGLSPVRPRAEFGGVETEGGRSGAALKTGLRKVTSLQMPPTGANPRLTRSSTAGPQYQLHPQPAQQQRLRHQGFADLVRSTQADTDPGGAVPGPLRTQTPGRLGAATQGDRSPNSQHPITRSKSAKAYTGSPRNAAGDTPSGDGRDGVRRISDSPGKARVGPPSQAGGGAQRRQGKLQLRLEDDDDDKADPEARESPSPMGSRFTPRARSCNAASSAAAVAAFAALGGDLDVLESPSAFWAAPHPDGAPPEDSLASASSSTSRPTRGASSKSSSRKNTPRRTGGRAGQDLFPTSPRRPPEAPPFKTPRSSSSLRRLHLQGPPPGTAGQARDGDRDVGMHSDSYGCQHDVTPGRRLGWGRRSFGVPGVDAAGELFVRSGTGKGARFRWPEGADVSSAWHSLTLRLPRNGVQPVPGRGPEELEGGKGPMRRFTSIPHRSAQPRGLGGVQGRRGEVSPRAPRRAPRSRSQGRQAERRQRPELSPRGRARSTSGPVEGRRRGTGSAAGKHQGTSREREGTTRNSAAQAAQSQENPVLDERTSSTGSTHALRLAALEAGFAAGLEVPHDDSAMLCVDEGAAPELPGPLEARGGGPPSSARPAQEGQRSSTGGPPGGDAKAAAELRRIQQQLKWLEQQEKEVEQQLQEVMGHAANGTARRPARRRSHSQGSEIALSVANPAVTPSSQDLAALKAPPSATKTETLECPQEDASRAQPARPAEEPPAPAAGAQAGNGSRASAPPPSQVVTAEAVSEVPPGGLGPALSAEGGGRSGGSPVFAPGASPRGSQPVSRLCPQCFDCASSWLGSVLEEAQVGCALVALDSHTILSCNHALTLLLGCTTLDLKGLPLPSLAPSPSAQLSITTWLEGMGKRHSSEPQSLECVLGTPAPASQDAVRRQRARIPQALRMTAAQATCLMPLPQALCSDKANMRLILFAAIAQL